tara:strand:+ start:1978 stop:2415 length:438 start_codon:yes stop_codon:yes gene_type:complete
MKLTKSQLKEIIKEELSKVLTLRENDEGSVLDNPNATDEEIIAYMNEVETEEEMLARGHKVPYMRHDFSEKRAWFNREGWRRLNAMIWTAHGGEGDPPQGVPEGQFQKHLQWMFDEEQPQSYEEAEKIYYELYDNMEEAAAGWDI